MDKHINGKCKQHYDNFREGNVRKLEKIENENKLLISKIKRIVKPNNTEEIKMEEAVKRLESKIMNFAISFKNNGNPCIPVFQEPWETHKIK